MKFIVDGLVEVEAISLLVWWREGRRPVVVTPDIDEYLKLDAIGR